MSSDSPESSTAANNRDFIHFVKTHTDRGGIGSALRRLCRRSLNQVPSL
jgi:hypothetical protein